MTTWHYQWVIIHDFLKRLCGVGLVDGVLNNDCSEKPNLCFYNFKHQPFIPVEFSVAAYRLHSMVRPSYHLSDSLEKRKEDPLKIFGSEPRDDTLNGERKLPSCWTIQWDRFVEYGNSQPQLSRRIDTTIAEPLIRLPFVDKFKSLPLRNVVRGWRLGLPSGQDVARRMGIRNPLDGNDPLWIYILKEAEKKGQGG